MPQGWEYGAQGDNGLVLKENRGAMATLVL